MGNSKASVSSPFADEHIASYPINRTAAELKLDLSCIKASTWAREASPSQTSWSRAPPMGLEGQLHHIIIHSKPGNEVPILISSN